MELDREFPRKTPKYLIAFRSLMKSFIAIPLGEMHSASINWSHPTFRAIDLQA
jgi:hypothetical protein